MTVSGVGDRARYPELVGAAEALMASGAVSNAIAADVRQRLDEAFSGAPTAPLRVRQPVVAEPSMDRWPRLRTTLLRKLRHPT